MDLETFIDAVFRITDDFVRDIARGHRPRRRGPAPVPAGGEVLTIHRGGRRVPRPRHRPGAPRLLPPPLFGHLFPGLRAVRRTTFLRQAANLRAVKGALRQHSAAAAGHEAALVLVDGRPVPVCRFARAHRCRSFAGLAAFGYDPFAHQTYYGLRLHLRLHLRVTRPGREVITAATLAPADAADRAVAPRLLAGLAGLAGRALGDGACWSPALRAELARGGLALLAPPRGAAARAAPWPRWLVRTRRRIETALSQLTERYHAKRVRARDAWHLTARWPRKLVGHTMASSAARGQGSPPAFEQLLVS